MEQFNIGKYKPFPSVQCTSVGSKNAGKVRASKFLLVDDMIGGIEEALNPTILDKLWDKYAVDARQRKTQDTDGKPCKEIHIATRWSVHDVIGRIQNMYIGNPRVKTISVPDVDPTTGESNFDYEYGGFTKEFFADQQLLMDEISYRCLYKQEPIEREGLLFPDDKIRRYFNLPHGEPEIITAQCDTKGKGTDYFVMPILQKYGEDYYCKISFAEVCSKYGFPLFSKEISECVADSRKYIRILTDRQTDRQTGIPFAYRIADLIGIDRRTDKENKTFVDLKMGNIPSEILKAPIRVKQLFGVKCEDSGSMYDRSKYLFMLNAPFEVSNQCCKVMKKQPMHQYNKDTGRVPITAQMASESKLRTSQWLQNGCNGFDLKIPTSNPMSFWTEQDVLLYIKENNLPICSVYGDVVVDYSAMGQCENQMSFADFGIFDKERPLLKTTGCKRTGCVLCGFGCHLEKEPNRFQMLKETHPKFHNLLYILKNNGVTYAEAIDWVNEHGNMNIKY